MTTTMNGLIKLAMAECTRMVKLKDATYSTNMKTAIESVLEMLITKSGNDPKMRELAVLVRETLK